MAVKPGIREIESEMFTPAMKQAMQKAIDKGNTLNDAVLGAANAYINMLVELVGRPKAIEMLEKQMEFLKSA